MFWTKLKSNTLVEGKVVGFMTHSDALETISSNSTNEPPFMSKKTVYSKALSACLLYADN